MKGEGIVAQHNTDIRAQLTRRCLLGIWVASLTGVTRAACAAERMEKSASMTGDWQQKRDRQVAQKGRLLARPAQVAALEAPVGLQPLRLSAERDGLLYVPYGYRADRPAPLVVMLHGAGGNAHQSLTPFLPVANVAGLILLAPSSRQKTWDIILGQYGPDIAFIDSALEQTFSRYAVDPNHIAVGGFSDGASYALSIGITNGDLFTHVIAFSPGFMEPAGKIGLPRLFISHGTRDEVLPINVCSRKIVPQLASAGYDVLYREFDGSHTIPPQIALSALAWFTSDLQKGIWGNLLKALFAKR